MQLSTTPTAGEARRQEEGHGYGLVLFASILLLVIGCFYLIQGIAGVANSHVFVANAHYVFANLRAWGRITLILGCLQLGPAGEGHCFISGGRVRRPAGGPASGIRHR